MLVDRIMAVLAALDGIAFAIMAGILAFLGEGFLAVILTPCVFIAWAMAAMTWNDTF